jgi:hypothetical protein
MPVVGISSSIPWCSAIVLLLGELGLWRRLKTNREGGQRTAWKGLGKKEVAEIFEKRLKEMEMTTEATAW